jgi:hypothetical protein
VVGDAGDHVGVGVDLGRSTGEPSMPAAPGRVRALSTASRTKSRWSPAVILVVSAFQYRMSNGGGVRPAR